MLVRDVMVTEVATIRPDSTLVEALEQLRSLEVRVLPVVERGGQLLGVIADRDLARGVQHPDSRPRSVGVRVADLMESEGVATTPDADVLDPARRMAELRIGAVPVVLADGRFAGMVIYADVLRALIDRAA